MATLATTKVFLILLAVVIVSWLLALFCAVAHGAAQEFPFRQRGTWWEALRKVSVFVMWVSLAMSGLSLLLNVIAFAKA